MRKSILFFAVLTLAGIASADSAKRAYRGIYYGPKNGTDYEKEKCKLDMYLPPDKFKNFPVLVYFHGGGLTGGSRGGPHSVVPKGIALIAPSYRLSPKAKCPDYLNDAAEAVAWTFKNIKKYGGDPDKIFIAGMSAGGYLTGMLGMDKRWLAAKNIDVDKIAGLLPVSGHMITHFTVRKEKKIKSMQGLSDEFSPLFHIRKTPFPIFIQCGDNDYPGRQEENKLFVAMMKKYAKQPASRIIYKEYNGTHGTFNSTKARNDLSQFILETSGMAEKSGLFDGKEREQEKVKLLARSFGNESFMNVENKAWTDSGIEILSSGGFKKKPP